MKEISEAKLLSELGSLELKRTSHDNGTQQERGRLFRNVFVIQHLIVRGQSLHRASSQEAARIGGAAASFPEDLSQAEELGSKETTSRSCRICELTFETVQEQREHFKTDWHRLNCKLNLKGRPIVSESKAADMLEKLQDGEESVSGSGSSDEDEMDMYEEGNFSHASSVELELQTKEKLVGWGLGAVFLNSDATAIDLDGLNVDKYWIVLLYSAGHFAGGVFKRGALVASKTYHRYVVRRKQGGAQSKSDTAGRKAKSVGSTIRRYNEQMLRSEVKELIESWVEYIKHSSRIFTAVSKSNRSVFFQSPDVLHSSDQRLRKVPFGTRRPTVNEVKRTMEKLALVTIEKCVEEQNVKPKPKSPTLALPEPPSTNEGDKDPKEKEKKPEIVIEVDPVFEILGEAIVDGEDFDQALLEKLELGGSDRLGELKNDKGETLLHIASSSGNASAVDVLMRNGVDPAQRDFQGRVAYNRAASKAVRDAFRYFRGEFPDRYDYDGEAAIPPGLTDDVERAKKEKAKLKKKRQEAKRKEKKQRKKRGKSKRPKLWRNRGDWNMKRPRLVRCAGRSWLAIPAGGSIDWSSSIAAPNAFVVIGLNCRMKQHKSA